MRQRRVQEKAENPANPMHQANPVNLVNPASLASLVKRKCQREARYQDKVKKKVKRPIIFDNGTVTKTQRVSKRKKISYQSQHKNQYMKSKLDMACNGTSSLFPPTTVGTSF